MKKIEAINVEQKDLPYRGPEIEKLVSLINEAISFKRWHNGYYPEKDIRNNYNPILLSPYDLACNESIRKEIVRVFSEKGWDCMTQECYDARGPHYCFFVSKKHFA